MRWELVGHLQSNKVKPAVECFDRVQSVDSIKLLTKLDRECEAHQKIMPILLEVNTGRDPAKYGIMPEATAATFEAVLACKHLHVEGLMTIAPLSKDKSVARQAFTDLRKLRDQLEQQYNLALPELSMGMTNDLEEAIAEGSTLVRIGTALFGER